MSKQLIRLVLSLCLFMSCEQEIDGPFDSYHGIELSEKSLVLGSEIPFDTVYHSGAKGDIIFSNSNKSIFSIKELSDSTFVVIAQREGLGYLEVTDSISLVSEKITVEVLDFIPPLLERNDYLLNQADILKIKLPDWFDSSSKIEIGKESGEIIHFFHDQNLQELCVRGLKSGTAQVTFIDRFWPRINLKIDVVESYPLLVNIDRIELSPEENKVYSLPCVQVGNGGYTISSSDEKIAKVELIDPWWILDPYDSRSINPCAMKVTSKGVEGTTWLTIQDEKGMEGSIEVVFRHK